MQIKLIYSRDLTEKFGVKGITHFLSRFYLLNWVRDFSYDTRNQKKIENSNENVFLMENGRRNIC